MTSKGRIPLSSILMLSPGETCLLDDGNKRQNYRLWMRCRKMLKARVT